jgi:hypothetical protein
MKIFLILFALVILFVIGSATALNYFDRRARRPGKRGGEGE